MMGSNRIIPFEAESYGDGIVAICNRPNKILRLYGIMYGENVAIIGGGGIKPGPGPLKNYPKLRDENKIIKKVKTTLEEAERCGDITISANGIKSKTNFIYNSKDYE